MVERLFAWYDRHGRSFPWRQTSDPWAILVSEVMSQQTQIDRIVGRYLAFLDQFPDPDTLAAASAGDVLAAWSGLGYNRRALHLQAAARVVATSGWPTTARELQTLPGVGPYTAAAVACFAFGEQIPAIDTNLKRVLSRWVGQPLDGQALAETARTSLPDGEAVRWNSAIMDLGAQVCKPVPRCDRCPVAQDCLDPTVYVPPPRQSRFDGSVRQTRGAIVRVMLDGETRTLDALSVHLGHDEARISSALTALTAEGVLQATAGGFALADKRS
ncbi:MAG: A/G-specific adenine glycosylase [Acidimicrobiia bacterium]|nr:A/G-specific adenine glycosylase [Acidimicrobiia bacterium]MDH5503179.1 A/G-specific adenine glycosylase [Acidimicrobiia bacterium]